MAAVIQTVFDRFMGHMIYIRTDVGIFPVYEDLAVGRQRSFQLKLGFLDIFQSVESFQMLRANGSDNTHFGRSQFAQLLNIAHVSCAHFTHEDLMGSPQHRADGLDNAHGGVVAFGGFQRVKLCLQKGVQNVFHAGLAETAGDTYGQQIGSTSEDLLGIINVVLIDGLHHP